MRQHGIEQRTSVDQNQTSAAHAGSAAASWRAFTEEAELLAASLDKAVQAIAGNAVDALENEIEGQHARCLSLLAALQSLLLSGSGRYCLEADSCSRRLGRVLAQLRLANDRYAAVLHHSGKTHRMLRAIHGQPYGSHNAAGAPRGSATLFFQG